MKPTDIRIREMTTDTEDFLYRSPIKFGGVAIDRATILNVHCLVETRSGQLARGFGSMPLGNVWAFPSKKLNYDQTLAAMKAVVERVLAIASDYREFGHPIDLTHALEPLYLRAAEEQTVRLQLADPIPPLCTLVAASPFDAALHDAFGKVHGLNCFSTLGSEFMSHDLGHYLGSDFEGEWLDRYVDKKAKPRMPLYHLVGALDPLTAADVKQPINDGLPETLAAWIPFDGLTHLKIKLNGEDLDWDVQRTIGVDRVAAIEQAKRGNPTWFYSLDFNEKCANVAYLLEFLRKLKELIPSGFEKIQYI